MAEQPKPTCSQCQHWLQQPLDANNLGQPRAGVCKGAPPQLVAIPLQPGQAQLNCQYPVTPPNFEACGLFRPRELSSRICPTCKGRGREHIRGGKLDNKLSCETCGGKGAIDIGSPEAAA